MILVAASAADLFAQQRKSWNEVSVGARRHVESSVLSDILPFEDGDFSYGVSWQYNEDEVYWQLLVDYTPGIEGTDFVITPRLNLMGTDSLFGTKGMPGFWRGGIGVCASYIDPKSADTDWSDIYWQFLLGVRIPIAGVSLDLQSFYPFERWSELNQFDVDDLEFGVSLSLPF